MAVRSRLNKALCEAFKENGEIVWCMPVYHRYFCYCFKAALSVYWPEEDDGTVSIHASTEPKGPQESEHEVGSPCLVSFGKKFYSGKIAGVGKRVAILLLFV